MHLLVPSGAKIGFVVWGLASLLSWAGATKRWALSAAVAVGAFYCLAVGAESPYLRAYAAALAGLAAGFWPQRDAGGLQAIALSSLALLLLWPHALFSAGFQMTYAAALGLWLSVPRWRLRAGPRWLRSAAQVLGVSFAVQLALWPILANVFGRGSAAGLLANVLLVPASGAYMAGGVLLWLGDVSGTCAVAVAHVMTAALAAFKATCAFFAQLPGAAFDLSPMGRSAVAAWYAACVGLFLLPEWRRSLVMGALALAILGGSAASARAAGPRLEICFLASGRGYATWAKNPAGETVLIGPGLAPARLKSALRELGGGPPERVPGPAMLEFGSFSLQIAENPRVAFLRRGEGPIEFCILRHPAAVAPAECFPAGIRGVGIEGAVWIITDGKRYEIASTTSGRPLRRPLL